MRDYYQTLGVDKSASQSDIRSAYRKLAMKYHPDRNPGDPEAENKFKEAQRAYGVLSDADKRRSYDQFGEAGVRGAAGGGASAAGFGDVFGDFFGAAFDDIFGGGRTTRSRARRGRDLELLLELDFLEAANGCQKKVEFPTTENCKQCNGSGARPNTKAAPCRHCGGSGQISVGQGFLSIMHTCPHCRGAGEVIENPCGACSGRGRVKTMRSITVPVPEGIDDGMRIRLSGAGETGGASAKPGDLYIVIRIRPHKLFHRDGLTLLLDVMVPITTAVLGGEVEVPSLTGKIKLKVPRGTQNGTPLRLRGKGIKFEGAAGDMICTVDVEIPVKLTAKQTELFEQLGKTLGEHHYAPRRKSWTEEVKKFFNSL